MDLWIYLKNLIKENCFKGGYFGKLQRKTEHLQEFQISRQMDKDLLEIEEDKDNIKIDISKLIDTFNQLVNNYNKLIDFLK
jgi:hypothetical protein